MGMLILERKKGELIEIWIEGMEPIVVAIMDIGTKNVKVGISAPKEVEVHRQEIADKIRSKGEKGNTR